MKIIDAHTHFDYLMHEMQPGVDGAICCAVSESDWQSMVGLIDHNTNIYGAFGIHPWAVAGVKDGFDKRLYDLLKNNSDFMVGEIGLDKYKPNMENQIDVFVKQLNIAIELQRQLSLHCVGAWDKILHILKSCKNLPNILVHDFNDSIDIMNNLLKHYDVFFSYHKIDKPFDLYRIEQTPIDRILVESDAKNDVILQDVITTIGCIKNESNICDKIYQNTKRFLNNA